MTGHKITDVPLGAIIEQKYKAPFWVVHRAGLQSALLARAEELGTIEIQTGCEFQCKREYESSKFECSETWAGPGQKPNKENCMRGAENNLQRCRNTCDAG